MKFTKMHGCGNDYVYVDAFCETVKDPSALARVIADRHFGVGGDGLILICPSETADARMRMFNADGSEGDMCGNGIRCVAKYVYDNKLTDKTSISVETLGGIKYLELNVENGRVETVRVDMGAPILTPAKIPVSGYDSKERIVAEPVLVAGEGYDITCVSMGNPHCIVYVDDVNAQNLDMIGPIFENYPIFPNRINTEFIQVLDKNTIAMRVWERGSGETLACGTGACASVVASVLNGFTDRNVRVRLLGGELDICWDEKDDHVYMTGPATTVFTGEIEI